MSILFRATIPELYIGNHDLNTRFEYKSPEQIQSLFRFPEYTYERFIERYNTLYVPYATLSNGFDSLFMKRQLWIRFLIFAGRLNEMIQLLEEYRNEYTSLNNEDEFYTFMNYSMVRDFNMNGESILHTYIRSNNIAHSMNIGRQLIQWTRLDIYDSDYTRCYENIHNQLWYNPFTQFCSPDNSSIFFSQDPSVFYVKNAAYHSIDIVVEIIQELSMVHNTVSMTTPNSIPPPPPRLRRQNAIMPRNLFSSFNSQ